LFTTIVFGAPFRIYAVDDSISRHHVTTTNFNDISGPIVSTLIIDPIEAVDFMESHCCVYTNVAGRTEKCNHLQGNVYVLSISL